MSLKNLNKEKGFSIPSVIMAGTLMSVIGLGITNMMTSNAQTIAYLEDKSAVMDLKNLITLQLSDQDSCKNSLSNINLSSNTLNIQNLRDKNNQIIYQSSSNHDKINIGNMRIENNNLPIATSSSGLVNLVIPIDRQRGQQTLSSLKIPVQVSTTNTSPIRVDNCVAVGYGASLNDLSRRCEIPPNCGWGGCGSPTNQFVEEGTTRVTTSKANNGSNETTRVCINKKWVTIENTFHHQEN